jgi:hypothetical protein
MAQIDFDKYKINSGLTLEQLAEMTGHSISGVKKWCDNGFFAIVDDDNGYLLAVRKPKQYVWELKEYAKRSKRLGVNQ